MSLLLASNKWLNNLTIRVYQFWIVCSCSLFGMAISAGEEISSSPTETLLTRYAGNYDVESLLGEPFVHTGLRSLLGTDLEHFMHNLNVRGKVDVISGTLAVAGNAPHQGGVEEAILCVTPHNRQVSAAIFSQGEIKIYSTTRDYQSLTLCIKDWITQVNSGHIDRQVIPANVRLTDGD